VKPSRPKPVVAECISDAPSQIMTAYELVHQNTKWIGSVKLLVGTTGHVDRSGFEDPTMIFWPDNSIG
jgi:hypothetical protein